MNILRNTVLIAFLISVSVAAQLRICSLCGKEISGKYVNAGGKYYHTEHFLCFKCGKPIKGEYSEEDNNFYHTDCYLDIKNLKCTVCDGYINGVYIKSGGKVFHRECYENSEVPHCRLCDKPITGHYVIYEDEKYHDYCYKGEIAEKCGVCGGALTGKYAVDLFGNKYHIKHEAEYSKCDNCKRIISPAVTGGGVKYLDQREICNICYAKSYKGEIDAAALLNKVLANLKQLGFFIDHSGVSLTIGGRDKLKEASGKMYSNNMNGYCASTVQTFKQNGRTIKKYLHKIYILDKIPMVYIESALVHELMHVWLSQNTNGKHLSDLREGSCNFISYVYIERYGNGDKDEVLKQFENDPHKIYGDGFRKVKEKFYNQNISDFFDYLRGNINI